MNTEPETAVEETAEAVVEEPVVRLKKDGTPAKKRGPKPGSKKAKGKKTTKKVAKKKTAKKKVAKKTAKKKRGRPRKDAVEAKKPGRKSGYKMPRDKQGRLLKQDGSLATPPGRKPTAAAKEKVTKTPARSTAQLAPIADILTQVKDINKAKKALRKQAQATLGTTLTQILQNGTSKRESNRLTKDLNRLSEALCSL